MTAEQREQRLFECAALLFTASVARSRGDHSTEWLALDACYTAEVFINEFEEFTGQSTEQGSEEAVKDARA